MRNQAIDLHQFELSKLNQFCSFSERLVIFTPNLLRKLTPEGLVDCLCGVKTLKRCLSGNEEFLHGA